MTTPKATPAPPTPKATCEVCGRKRGAVHDQLECYIRGYIRQKATADRRGKLLGEAMGWAGFALREAIRAELEGS